jgi:hypothetical protein
MMANPSWNRTSALRQVTNRVVNSADLRREQCQFDGVPDIKCVGVSQDPRQNLSELPNKCRILVRVPSRT